MRCISEAVECPGHGGKPRLARRPGNLRDRARQVQADLVDTAESGWELLDQPHAGGAVDPLEVEPGAATLAADLLGRFALKTPVVEILEAPPGDTSRLEHAMLAFDEPVILIESPLPDQRVHLPATVAAELLRLPLANEACRNRKAAMRAGHGCARAAGREGTNHRFASSRVAGSAGTVSLAA